MKKWAAIFMVMMLCVFSACSSKGSADTNSAGVKDEVIETDGAENETTDEAAEGTEEAEDGDAAGTEEADTEGDGAAPLESYTEEDILGNWYAWDDLGNLMTLRVDYNETAAGQDPFFVIESYDELNPIGRYGAWYVTDMSVFPEDVDPSTIPSYQFQLTSVNGEAPYYTVDSVTYQCICTVFMYDDNTLHFKDTLFKILEDGTGEVAEETEWIFQRTLPWSGAYGEGADGEDAYGAGADEGMLDGVWLAAYEDEVAYFMMNPSGRFILEQEDTQVYGHYALNGENLTITAEIAEGEAVPEDEAVIEVGFVDGKIQSTEEAAAFQVPFEPVTGGISGTYTAENGYVLEFCEDGTFYMAYGYNQTAGIYVADGENVTMYSIFSGGHTYNGFFAKGTVTADSADLINMEDNHMVFTAD